MENFADLILGFYFLQPLQIIMGVKFCLKNMMASVALDVVYVHISDFLCFNWGGAYSSFSCLEEPLVIKHLHIPHSGMFTQA